MAVRISARKCVRYLHRAALVKTLCDNSLAVIHGGRKKKCPHHYPDSHPQSKPNAQESWCYPLAALGAYHEWLQDVYIEGGKFSNYLNSKVSKGRSGAVDRTACHRSASDAANHGSAVVHTRSKKRACPGAARAGTHVRLFSRTSGAAGKRPAMLKFNSGELGLFESLGPRCCVYAARDF